MNNPALARIGLDGTGADPGQFADAPEPAREEPRQATAGLVRRVLFCARCMFDGSPFRPGDESRAGEPGRETGTPFVLDESKYTRPGGQPGLVPGGPDPACRWFRRTAGQAGARQDPRRGERAARGNAAPGTGETRVRVNA